MSDLNKFFKNILIIILIFYIVYFIPKLNSKIISHFNNVYVRILFILVILLIGLKDPVVAILLSVCFVLMHLRLQKYLRYKEYKNNKQLSGNDYSIPNNELSSIIDSDNESVNESVNESNESVNESNESVNESNEFVNESNEFVNESNESVNESNESVNESNEFVNESNESVNESNESVNESNESVNESSVKEDDPLEDSLNNSLNQDISVSSDNIFEKLKPNLHFSNNDLEFGPYDKENKYTEIDYEVKNKLEHQTNQLNKIDQINNNYNANLFENLNNNNKNIILKILDNEEVQVNENINNFNKINNIE